MANCGSAKGSAQDFLSSVEIAIKEKSVYSFVKTVDDINNKNNYEFYKEEVLIKCLKFHFTDGLNYLVSNNKIKGKVISYNVLSELINSTYYDDNMIELSSINFFSKIDFLEYYKYVVYLGNEKQFLFLLKNTNLNYDQFKIIIQKLCVEIKATKKEDDIYKRNIINALLSMLLLTHQNFERNLLKNEADLFKFFIWPKLNDTDKATLASFYQECEKFRDLPVIDHHPYR